MNIDINTIFNMLLTAAVGYIQWSFRDRDAKKEERIKGVEIDVKTVCDKVASNETKYYKDFVTREQHDMDINAVMKKLDETNGILREMYKDIGTLIGRNQSNGK